MRDRRSPRLTMQATTSAEFPLKARSISAISAAIPRPRDGAPDGAACTAPTVWLT